MAGVLRKGDVVWANLDPVIGHEQAGQRPVLVISDDILNRHSGTVIAMHHPERPPADPVGGARGSRRISR